MSLAPMLLAAAAAVLALGRRRSVLGNRWVRLAAVLAVLAVLAAAAPRIGGERAWADRTTLVIAALVTGFLAVRGRMGLSRRIALLVLGAAAAGSVTAYVDFFKFHGDGNSVHYHDVAHYYLGSKYFPELGYTGLYTGMLRAEAEVFDNHFASKEARDLVTNRIVSVVPLLQRSETVKAAFSPARWEDFKRDVAFFRTTMQGRYPAVLLDHGYNPTPFWTLVGGRIAGLVPPGNAAGIFLLTLLDPVLLVLMFAAVAWAFGIEAMLLAVTFFCTCFAAGYPWLGGAFFRFPWLFGVVSGTCLLHRSRPAAGGVLWAGAVLLRVFPAVLLAGPVLGAAARLFTGNRGDGGGNGDRDRPRFLLAVAGTGAVLFLLTGTMAGSFGSWGDFRGNTTKYQETIASNVVGLTSILAFTGPERAVSAEEAARLQHRRTVINGVQLATLFLAVLVLFARAARGLSLLDSLAMGTVLLFTGLNLAAYYYLFLVLMVLAHRNRDDVLALVFGGEVLIRGAAAFEASQGVQSFYRSLFVLILLAAVYGRTLIRGPGKGVAAPATAPHRSRARRSHRGGAPVPRSG
jgi:hypothetical protein